jgi:formylglycine-generating enzyme required for sulfatase activity
LEYEKACRGGAATSGEYAWGSAVTTQATSITNSGQNSEVAGQTGNGLSNYGNGAVAGPLRCGFPATATTTTRAQTGQSLYGGMELSGNLAEFYVTVGQAGPPGGRIFNGTYGTGALSAGGNATNSDWPGYAAGEVSGAAGSGVRGGSWSDATNTICRVSERGFSNTTYTTRDNNKGGRLGRRP